MKRKYLYLSLTLLAAFALWTVLVSFVDIAPIGPRDSSVGFAGINGPFHRLTGVHMALYVLTDWLGLVPVGFMFGFALLGLIQWILRRKLLQVDRSILILGLFYLAVLAVYLGFEEVVINRRPVLIDGFLEASYPSSTTTLVLCVMPTTIAQLNSRIKNQRLQKSITFVLSAFSAFMVIGRLISGVHWLTDIIGGVLVSAGLVMLYVYFTLE